MVETTNDETITTGGLAPRRLKVSLRGAVQGVGFRPFVHRLAGEHNLNGWVVNSCDGAELEVEGPREQLDAFLRRLSTDKPPLAFYQSCEAVWLDPAGLQAFAIRESVAGAKTAVIVPDVATCPDCQREVFDPRNRRYRYPFTNCTNCGPRFSIIHALPYDRCHTSMRNFRMCPDCQAEYDNPADRRFHAQPNACPRCGPQLQLWDQQGNGHAEGDAALKGAAAALLEGKILALKGLGGFQLLVDARQAEAVARLRQRKHREEKPFAIMAPDLAAAQDLCEVSELEARLLASPEKPIVLLRRRPPGEGCPAEELSELVAPGNPWLGVMLPYTPLHLLLMAEVGRPVVATSGNLSEEPICLDEQEALGKLGGIADLFLVHDRPIVRQVDDSVARVMLGRELVLRRARGYAPLPITLKAPRAPVVAVGAQMKNTVALAVGHQVFLSQHIGDLETAEAFGAFERTLADFERLYELRPASVVCDAHPDYRSTQHARQRGLPVVAVQHHFAHLRSCMAENQLEPPVLGVIWDGTGYGTDGHLWGGEFLLALKNSFQRMACWRPFRLPGGEQAIREPRRAAFGLLAEIFGPEVLRLRDLAPVRAFSEGEAEVLLRMLDQGLNAPQTTSAGRLFDAVAALAGLRQYTRHEGQAAMELEFAAGGHPTASAYPLRLDRAQAPEPAPGSKTGPTGIPLPQTGMILIDWEPMIWGMLEDLRRRAPAGLVAARFHNTLVEALVAVARLAGEERVALSGGCFQNQYLATEAVRRLAEEGFRPYWHQRVPPNDGGIALGQIAAGGEIPARS
jgi:hydrogenase maturation protein HypF